ncbi:MAG: type II toxin-antitoxin system prevent-host-death family antitoxin [Hyphomicrobium aestuarii]|nr:type II toxin-antitoxin system prevent-host-death family antitoxin [Hyphomicrobium aestuarii]
MAQITIHAAKTNLSKLIARAQAGEEIVIVNGKTPVARLTAVEAVKVERRYGAYKAEFELPDSFFDPLPEEELAAWEGSYDGDPLRHPRPTLVASGQPAAIADRPVGDSKRPRRIGQRRVRRRTRGEGADR